MKRSNLLALAGLAGLTVALSGAGLVAVNAKPLTYVLPDETAAFKPGPNLEVVQGNCGACHSADYVASQPQGPAFKKAFWEAEVTKMIKVYGAPIDEADVPKIVDYLTQVY
jgi:mono/diheme cytochrome c family protein